MHIQYLNFEPENHFIDEWKETLSLLHEKSPSNSSLCSCLAKADKGYWGSIRVRSLQGEFAAFFEHDELAMLAEKLKLRILEEIDAWHEARNEHSENEILDFHHKWMSDDEQKHLKERCQDHNCPLMDS